MDFREVIRVALRALARNKMRTILTMLGIIIGVGAVICTVAIGQGAGQQVQNQIKSLGDNMIMVMAGSINQGGVRLGSQATKTLVAEDGDAIKNEVPNVVAESPSVGATVQMVNGNQNWSTRATGVSADYFTIRSWPVSEGSEFTQRDVTMAANVCVIGQTVANELFTGGSDPVGALIRVNNLPFTVVGVLEKKGQNSFGQDQDDTVIIPYTTVQKKISGISWVQQIMVSVASEDDIESAMSSMSSLLRQRHKLRQSEDDDFMVRSPDELAQASAQTSQILTYLLGSVASVSLLVGGIGIMNIMLVSVTERTREIGVRMAVGATEQDVKMQFLSEAMVLSFLGGSVGIVLGVIASAIISNVLKWSTLVSTTSIIVAVFFSAGVGVFFGYYPASKAAQLDPIEALRYE
jgi:putative ABC transport system permease protein